VTSQAPVQISVALVTRNRPESLERCLQSWRAQTVAPFEIVISDDSDDSFAPATKNLAARFACKYVTGPKRGLYANRNCAALACAGSHIISADDDHTHPVDFFEKVQAVTQVDPARVWTFGERFPDGEHQPINRPTELHRSGAGCLPANPDDSAAISDGASVYPRQIFDGGLRYDETYPFGGVWYLWGKLLKERGWRISYSSETFVWHHLKEEGRHRDKAFLERQICCNTYVIFVNALFIESSASRFLWSCYYLLRRMLIGDSSYGYKVRSFISLKSAFGLLRNVMRAQKIYSNT
jgi:glycosyltransferase involved in cell wall biosynthesis